MNHLESAFYGKNAFWRYLVMFTTVFIAANTIGAIPLVIVMVLKTISDPSTLSELAANPSEYSILGLSSNAGLVVMLFPFIAGLIAFAMLVKPLNARTLTETINGTSRVRWGRIIVSGLIWMIISAIYLFIQVELDRENFVLNNLSNTLIMLVVISFIFIPFQAAFEEILFRGYLMHGFAVLTRNRWAPVLLTSLFFALMHIANPEIKEFGILTMMPQYFLFGLVFGITTVLDDGIEIALGAHAANNIFLSVMLTHKSSTLQTPALFEQTTIHPWNEFVGLLISSIVFLAILKYIFRWKNLKIMLSKLDRTEKIQMQEFSQ